MSRNKFKIGSIYKVPSHDRNGNETFFKIASHRKTDKGVVVYRLEYLINLEKYAGIIYFKENRLQALITQHKANPATKKDLAKALLR